MKRISFFLSLLFLLPAIMSAQNVTTPYSMYGYGILGDKATSMQRQMGSIGYAMSSGRQINVMNPASYAAIDSLTFLFDMGADVSILWQKEGSAKEQTTGGGLDYITMQFPLSKFIGGSIGMLPYSSVGYAFGKDVAHGALENQGTGGINQAYIGLAGTYAGVSLGANIAYNFGNIQNDYFAMPAIGGRTLIEHIMQIRDWDLTIGLQYKKRISQTDRIGAGITFSPKKSLHGKTWVTTQEVAQGSPIDTISFMGMKGKYYTPDSWGLGLSYSHEASSYWMAEVDLSLQKWGSAKYSPMYEDANPSNMVFEGMNFKNRYRVAAGGEYIPKVRGNFGQRITYRAGAYYCQDYLCINGNQVKEYGVTGGIGLPTAEGKTMINIGVEWKRRLASPVNLISENYLNITFGVNFNEMWFWKRKIR